MNRERDPAAPADLANRLRALRDDGLYRRLLTPDGVDLTGNDYLGLAADPRVRDALIGALNAGTPHGSTGSRLLSGNHPVWSPLEARFAAWQRQESALFLPSGYHANVALLGALLQPNDVVISDRLNHASLIDGMRLTRAERVLVDHGDIGAVSRAITEAGDRTCYVAVESVYSMDGDLAPLRDLAALCDGTGARLIVDEAHATGLFGSTGAGRIEAEGASSSVFASVHTCGKALGLAGAFIACSSVVKDMIINTGRPFIFSTGAPPFHAAAIHAAIDVVERSPALRQRPLELAQRLRAALPPLPTGNSDSHIVPVIPGDRGHTLRLADALRGRGWDVRPIRPPTVPKGQCRIRLVVNATLSENQIDDLATDVHALWTPTR